MEGLLEKKGQLARGTMAGLSLGDSWKKRYFVLDGETLTLRYYNPDVFEIGVKTQRVKPLGEVLVIGVDDLEIFQGAAGHRPHRFDFVLADTRRDVLSVAAPTAEHRLKWLRTVRQSYARMTPAARPTSAAHHIAATAAAASPCTSSAAPRVWASDIALSRDLQCRGEWSRAIAALERAARQSGDDKDPEPWYELGVLLMPLDDDTRQQDSTVSSHNSSGGQRTAAARTKAMPRPRMPDRAKAALIAATNADPMHTAALYRLARLLEEEYDDVDAAEATYKRAIASDPASANVRADGTLRTEFSSARALSPRPAAVDARTSLGRLLWRQRKLGEQAAKQLRAAIALQPMHADAHTQYGVVLEAAFGKTVAAEQLYRKAISFFARETHQPLGTGAIAQLSGSDADSGAGDSAGVQADAHADTDATTYVVAHTTTNVREAEATLRLGALLARRMERKVDCVLRERMRCIAQLTGFANRGHGAGRSGGGGVVSPVNAMKSHSGSHRNPQESLQSEMEIQEQLNAMRMTAQQLLQRAIDLDAEGRHAAEAHLQLALLIFGDARAKARMQAQSQAWEWLREQAQSNAQANARARTLDSGTALVRSTSPSSPKEPLVRSTSPSSPKEPVKAFQMPPRRMSHTNGSYAAPTDADAVQEVHQLLKRAIDLDTDFAEAHAHLGCLLADEHSDYVAAEKEFRMAMQLPGSEQLALPCFKLALLLEHQHHDYDGAIEMYRRALAIDPRHAQAHFALGSILEHSKGDKVGAGEQYAEALEFDPDHAEAHFALATLLNARFDYDAAEDHYRSAIRLDPYHVEAHSNLGLLLKSVHRDFSAAERCYRRALMIDPGYAHAHLNLGVLMKNVRGNLSSAERHYRQAIQLAPQDPWAQYNLGRLLMESNRDLVTAERHFHAFIKLEPDAPEGPRALAELAQAKAKHVGEQQKPVAAQAQASGSQLAR